jgi:uncharacterized membrane protein YkoI
MKLKSFLAVLVAFLFVFSLSCKKKAEGPAPEKAEAQGKVVEKAEAEEAEEKEAKEEKEEEEVELPAAVAKAVQDNVPGAEIDKLEVAKEAGITLYDIEFKAGKGEIEVAEDGTVMDIVTIVQMNDLPRPAAEAIQKATEEAKATIKRLEKSEVRAEIQKEGEKGTIVKLATPKYVYEAELVRDNQTGEITVDPEGKVVEATKWD